MYNFGPNGVQLFGGLVKLRSMFLRSSQQPRHSLAKPVARGFVLVTSEQEMFSSKDILDNASAVRRCEDRMPEFLHSLPHRHSECPLTVRTRECDAAELVERAVFSEMRDFLLVEFKFG